METLLGLAVGIGLSAACGFRVFVPFLGMSIASLGGHLTLSPGFEWIGSWPALVAFATATVLEIGAYYIPWLDNVMDSITTPAAVIAGTIVTASMVGDMSPFLKWSLALIAGGGTAGMVQGATVMLRGASTATTAGLGNHLVATGEMAGAVLITVVALFLPLLAALLVIGMSLYVARRIGMRMRGEAVQAGK
ncbi:MAG TPA: DUF4126 domain-containing protein [Dissulfurispiraceae bacterium]|nr:DUF4126 domain-containing protein [Dissulfurispiraceae bacterium]